MGLAEGKRIKTDCKVNWTAPDGKLFCFGNVDSKSVFLKDPETNRRRAVEQFAIQDANTQADDMGRYSADDITKFIKNEITAVADKKGGLFPANDSMLGKTVSLGAVLIDGVVS